MGGGKNMANSESHEVATMGATKSGGDLPHGKVQKEVMEMLTGDNPMTVPQIACSRKTTIWAVYDTIRKLKQKGYIIGSAFRGYEKGSRVNVLGATIHPITHCLHAQRFIAKLINFDNGYAKQQYMQKLGNNGITFHGNTIKLRRNCIEIYSLQRFKGTSDEDCDKKALSYWETYLEALQGKYGAILLKSGEYPITEVYCHIALEQNGIAYNQNMKHDRIMYFDATTRKLWLSTDRSFKGFDLEVEGVFARKDSQLLHKHLEDMRNPSTPSLTEIYKLVVEVVKLEAIRTQNMPMFAPEHIEDTKKKHRELPSYFG
jgi:hypothetical protein